MAASNQWRHDVASSAASTPKPQTAAAYQPPASPQPLENDADHDDILDDDDASSVISTISDTSSNFSSVSHDSLPLIHAYGHTYHGSGRSVIPNDASEARRMALQHELYQLCLDGGLIATKLNLSGYTPEKRFQILDVGAGSGLWSCAMAARYPQAEILGIDLDSALLPEDVPRNVTFEIADAMDPWPEKQYDFIHMRNLLGGGIRDWTALLESAYAHLKPGGRLEFTEIRPLWHADGGPSGDSKLGAACMEYEMAYWQICVSLGIDCDPIPKVPGLLTSLGAEAVRERADWVPVRSWGNDPIVRKKGHYLNQMIDYGGLSSTP